MAVGVAHGKIILMGEHSVVYHHPAIALPLIENPITATVVDAKEMTITSKLYSGKLETAPESLKPVKELVSALKLHLNTTNVHIEIKSDIPIAAGFGSSAAVAAAITEAMYKFENEPLSKKAHFDWTQYSETFAHGSPSGIDAMATRNTQGIIFRKNKETAFINRQLNAYLIIVHSGEKVATKETVGDVRTLMEQGKAQQSIQSLGDLTERTIEAYRQNQPKQIGVFMDQAQTELRLLTLSNHAIDDAVQIAKSKGALGAKLSGGGRGGAVIALAENESDAKAIKTAWQKKFTETWLINLNRG